MAEISASNLSNTVLSTVCCSFLFPSVIMGISARNANVFLKFVILRTFVSWNSVGILISSQNPVWIRQVPESSHPTNLQPSSWSINLLIFFPISLAGEWRLSCFFLYSFHRRSSFLTCGKPLKVDFVQLILFWFLQVMLEDVPPRIYFRLCSTACLVFGSGCPVVLVGLVGFGCFLKTCNVFSSPISFERRSVPPLAYEPNWFLFDTNMMSGLALMSLVVVFLQFFCGLFLHAFLHSHTLFWVF